MNKLEGKVMRLQEYMKIKDAAVFLGVNRSTLRRWENSNYLKSYRNPVNNYRLYLKKDLESFLCLIRNQKMH